MNSFRSRFLMVAGLAGTAGLLLNVNCGGGSSGGTGGKAAAAPPRRAERAAAASGGSSHRRQGRQRHRRQRDGRNGSGGSGTGGSGGSGTGGGEHRRHRGRRHRRHGWWRRRRQGRRRRRGRRPAARAARTPTAARSRRRSPTRSPRTLQGFALDTYSGAGNLVNLDGGTKPTLTWDNTVGSPARGLGEGRRDLHGLQPVRPLDAEHHAAHRRDRQDDFGLGHGGRRSTAAMPSPAYAQMQVEHHAPATTAPPALGYV